MPTLQLFYTNLLSWNSKTYRDVSDAEHHAFLMYFFNKYFYSTNSFGVIKVGYKGSPPFIRMLLSNQGYAWGPLFIALLNKGMESLLRQVKKNGHYSKAEGPIWFRQLWAQLYFPNFSSMDPFSSSSVPPRFLGSNLTSTPTLPVDRVEVLQVLFDVVPNDFD